VRSHLLREGTFEQLSALGFWEAELRADALIEGERWEDDGTFVMPFEGRLLAKGDRPLLFSQQGDRVLWVPPDELKAALPERVLDMTEAMKKARVRTMIRLTANNTEFVLPGRHSVELVPAGDGHVTPVISGEARVDPRKAAGGSKPRAGRWEVLAAVTVCGFSATGRARARRSIAEYGITVDTDGSVLPRRAAMLASVKGKFARAVPGLARVARRAQERRAAASH
jgi:hypothetical protein